MSTASVGIRASKPPFPPPPGVPSNAVNFTRDDLFQITGMQGLASTSFKPYSPTPSNSGFSGVVNYSPSSATTVLNVSSYGSWYFNFSWTAMYVYCYASGTGTIAFQSIGFKSATLYNNNTSSPGSATLLTTNITSPVNFQPFSLGMNVAVIPPSLMPTFVSINYIGFVNPSFIP